VVLDTFGTARDLANAGIVLREGLELVAYDWSDDEEDLEGYGTVHFDPGRRWWVAELDERGVLYVPKKDRAPVTTFLCVACRQDLAPWLARGARNADTRCPACGTPVFASIAPPKLTE
jgi:hypothetical protein